MTNLTRSFIVFYVVIQCTCLIAQDLTYAKKAINRLCSPEFHGRGYENDGNKIAAAFLHKELKSLGLKKFNNSYYQKFSISVNTFPNEVSFSLSGKQLELGVDFIMSGSSPPLEGKYNTILLNQEFVSDARRLELFFMSDLSNHFLVLDIEDYENTEAKKIIELIIKYNLFGAVGVIELTDKNISYTPSARQYNFPHIYLDRNKYKNPDNYTNSIIRSKYLPEYRTQNVIGYIEGEIDDFLVFSAHYDHLGRVGNDIYFPGANDNASGVAMVLALAKYYSSLKQKPYYSMAFMFFGAEEIGLLGSKYYTDNPFFPLGKIKMLTNLDMVGSGDDGITIVNGSVFKKQFNLLDSINNSRKYLPSISTRGEAANSDHYYFYVKNVPSFFIYTEGEYKEYHNIYDKAEYLPLNEFKDLFRLLRDFYHQFAYPASYLFRKKN